MGSLRCVDHKKLRVRAYDLNFEFQDNSKCAICWGEYEHATAQCLLKCGHRFHAHCLDEYETGGDTEKATYYRCPSCRQLYGKQTRWPYHYAFHLLSDVLSHTDTDCYSEKMGELV